MIVIAGRVRIKPGLREEALALAAHFKTPHLLAFREHLPRLLAAPPDIKKYAVSATGRA